jgi:hypothetical protein
MPEVSLAERIAEAGGAAAQESLLLRLRQRKARVVFARSQIPFFQAGLTPIV